MIRTCLCCNQPLGHNVCDSCGFQDMSQMTWIPDSLKLEFATVRKPITLQPSIEKIKTLADKAAKECGFQPTSLVIKNMDSALMDTVIRNNNPKVIDIHCNLRRLRCYTEEELLALLREQIMYAKTFEKGAPFTPISVIQKQQLDYRFKLKLAYDAFVAHKQYVESFPIDKNLHSAKDKEFSLFLVECLQTKYQVSTNPDLPFLQPSIVATEMYQDASLHFFEENDKLKSWVTENKCQALYAFWRWLHEDFSFIAQYTSGRGETEKLLQLTEFLSSYVFSGLIFTSNELGFLTTFQSNMQFCDQNTTNPTGKSLIRSWRTRFDRSPYKFP